MKKSLSKSSKKPVKRLKLDSSFLKIGPAAKTLGVSIDTLRRWEKSGKITAERTPGGTRLYSLSALKQVNPSVETYQIGSLSTEELLKKVEKDTILGYKDTTRTERSPSIPVSQYPSIPTKSSLLTKFLIGSAVLSVITLLITTWITVSHFTSKNEPPPPVLVTQQPSNNSAVLAVTSTSPFLEINSDTQINGLLSVRDSINGLTLEATPSAGTMTLNAGTTTLTVTKDALLDQDVSTTATPGFNTLNLSATKDQLVFQSGAAGGTLTWTPTAARTITLPDATDTLVGKATTDTLTNKSISGSSNTLTNIPNSALTNSKVTVTAGTNLTGGGDITLGSSVTIALKDSPSITSLTTTGIVSLADGTAAAPALTFTSDTNTGLYRIGADNIALITGGTATSGITIDSSGNVGIADNTPSYKLDVTGTANVSSNLTVGGTGSFTSTLTASNGLTLTTGALSLTSTSGSAALTLSSSATAFNVQSGLFDIDTQSSRVGIGTASPGSTLNVIGNVGIGTSSAGASLAVNGNGVIGWGTTSVAGPSNGLGISGNVGIGTTTPNNKLQVIGAGVFGSDWGQYSAPASGLLVQGNVGIGATTSNNKLDVWGNSRLAGTLAVDSTSSFGGNLTLNSGQFLAPNGTFSLPSYSFTNSTSTGIYSPSSNALALNTNGASTPPLTITAAGSVGIGVTAPTQLFQVNPTGPNSIVITSAGNVGIGTTSPIANLHVTGTSKFDGISTHGNVLPDADITYDLGSAAVRWNNAYVYTLTATNIAGVVTGGSTTSSDWMINANNTLDSANSTLTFKRGSPTNAVLQWYGNNNTFDFNSGIRIGVNNGSASTIESTTGLVLSGFANDITTGTNEHLSLIPNGTGNVGIGTSSPGALLGVLGGVNIGGGTSRFAEKAGPTNGLAVEGNVGIGLTSPLAPLHVWGNNTDSAFFLNGNVGIGTISPSSGLNVYGTSQAASQLTIQRLDGTARSLILTPASSSLYASMTTSSTLGLLFNTAGYQELYLNGSGNVGIGTTNPSYQLQTTGNVGIGGSLTVTSAATFSSTGTFTSTLTASNGLTLTTGALNLTSTSGQANLALSSNTNAFTINGLFGIDTTSGRVGIGTTAPQVALQVLGGNVGIGTSAAGAALQVNGGGLFGWGTASVAGPANGLAVSGNVGIGTTSFTSGLSGLQIQPAARTKTALLVTDSDGSSSFEINLGSGGQSTIYQRDAEGVLKNTFGTGGDSYITGGNVGIGFTSPNALLHINGANQTTAAYGIQMGSDITLYRSAANTLKTDNNLVVGGTITGSGTQFLAANGTASLPSYSFSNLTNAGLWTNGDGLLLTTGGTNTKGITVTGAGNVGIGVTNPVGALQVNGAAAIGYGSIPTSSLPSNGLAVSGNVGIGTTTATHNLEVIGTANFTGNVGVGNSLTTTGLTVANGGLNVTGLANLTGNVGIGSSLTVTSAGVFSGGLMVDGGSVILPTGSIQNSELENSSITVNATAGTGLSVSGSPVSLGGTLTVAGIDASTTVKGVASFNSTNFSVSSGAVNTIQDIATSATPAFVGLNTTSGNVGIGTSATGVRLAVNGTGLFGWGTASVAGPANGLAVSGNVGIGTTSPLAPLHVWGNNTDSAFFLNGNVGIGTISPSSGLNIYGTSQAASQLTLQRFDGAARSLILTPSSSSLYASMTTSSTLGLLFNTTGYQELYLNGSGNVGIGTTNPSYQLQTTGNVGIGGSLTVSSGLSLPNSSILNSYLVNSSINVSATAGTGLSVTGSPVSLGGTLTVAGIDASTTVKGVASFNSTNFSVSSGAVNTIQDIAASSSPSFSALTLSGNNNALSFTGTTPSLTSGSSVFGLFAGGNVGIGTTGNLYGGLTVRGAGTSTGISLQTYGSNLTQGLTVLDNGNVGIGTTGPFDKLEVRTNNQNGIGGRLTITNFAARPSVGNSNEVDLGFKTTSSFLATYYSARIAVIEPESDTNNSDMVFYLFNNADGTAGGLERMRINNTGNIGIGMSAPDRLLHIAGTIDITPTNAGLMGVSGTQFDISGATTNAAKKLVLGIDTTDNYGVIQAGNTSGTNYALSLNPAGGNVGIGNTYPAALLDIGLDGTTEGKIIFRTTGAAETAPSVAASAGNLVLTTPTGWVTLTPDNGIQVTGNGNTIWWQANNGNALFDLYKGSTATALTINNTAGGAGATASLSVPNGNVGIGTSARGASLAINGNSVIGWGTASVAGPSNGLAVFGNVGIGTTSPGAALDVVGTAQMTGFKLTTSPTNNYVLTSDANGVGTWQVAGGLSGGTANYIPLWTNATTQTSSVMYQTSNNIGIGTTGPGAKLEVVGDILSKGTSWTLRTSAADNQWYSVTYGNGLFVAVADTGTSNRVMTSSDGITWTLRTSAADNSWNSVTYGNGLFVAVAPGDGTGNRVMTSSDGITWTLRTSAADNQWRSVTYGNGLFVAVADTGTSNRVMTSSDGITWTLRTSAADNSWKSVTYGNGLFVAVAQTGTSNRVMTSSDGITWTLRTSAADNSWNSVTYGNGLFVAVAADGTDNRVMTSSDGITWTSRTSAADNQWNSVTYGNGLFVASAMSGTSNRVMTSPDGITWTLRTSAADNQWRSVTYGNGLFVAVANTGTGNSRVMTSGKTDYSPFSANNIYQGGMSIFGNVGLGSASPVAQLDVRNTNTSTGLHMYVGSSAGQFGILDNGNVGIGTTSPAYQLQTTGNVGIGGSLTVSSAVTFSSLVSCNTIDTNASGVLVCGTDAGASQQTFTADGTWTKPSGAIVAIVEAVGAGGGGGGGSGLAAGTWRDPGGGGGGGAITKQLFQASALGATESVTVGAGGTAGTAGSSGSGGDGGVGGNSSFGSYITIYGGGGGAGGAGGAAAGFGGGGGGGTGSAGGTGSQSTGGTGGSPTIQSSTAGDSLGGRGALGDTNGASAKSAEFGGGGGGAGYINGGGKGGSSLYAGAGGGGGGGVSNSNIEYAGEAGGAHQSYTKGGGGAGGAVNGNAGTAGTTRTYGAGDGGGGGGGQDSGTAGAGAAGGAPGGGGGGGGGGTTVGGAGAAGGRGEVRVWTVTGGAGADLAEVYFSLDFSLEGGDVVVADQDLPGIGFKKSSKAYDGTVLGIVSTQPGLVLGDDSQPDKDAKPVQLALAGRVPVKVSTENGPIQVGDYLTSSSIPGVAMKATKAGPTVGKALEEWDESKILGYYDTTKNEYISKENLSPNIQISQYPNLVPVGKLMTFVNVSWYDPDALRNNLSDISVNLLDGTSFAAAPSRLYTVSSSVSGAISRVGAFDTLALGSLTAGEISADSLNVNHITVQGQDLLTTITSLGAGLDSFEVSTASSSASLTAGDVVTTDNGQILGVSTNDKPPNNILLSGKTSVKVSTENGPIMVGDYLTSSATSGVAMKATRPGTVVGKALEGYDNPDPHQVGTILIFVNVTFADPGNFLASLSLDEEGNMIIPKIRTSSLLIGPISQIGQIGTDGTQITTNSDPNYTSPGPNLASNTNSYIDLSGEIASLEDKIKSLESRVEELAQNTSGNVGVGTTSPVIARSPEATAAISTSSAEIASSSATPRNDVESLNLTPPDILLNTDSAVFTNLTVKSEATISGQLAAYDLSVSNSFKSLGKTSLADTSIAGTLSVDGTLSIEQGKEINVLGTLYLQKTLLAQGVDIFNGKITIDPAGNITTQGKIIATEVKTNKLTISNTPIATSSATLAASIGTATLPANATSVTIQTNQAYDSAKVFITPLTNTDKTLSVTNIKNNESFDVSVLTPSTADINFNWWIIQTN